MLLEILSGGKLNVAFSWQGRTLSIDTSGVEDVGDSYGTDFHPCSLCGDENHLCVYSGAVGAEFSRGQGIIMDSSYRTVKTVHSGNGRVPSDGHEFNVLRGGTTALITIYQPVQYDMSEYNISSSQGWIMDGIAQEIDIESGEYVSCSSGLLQKLIVRLLGFFLNGALLIMWILLRVMSLQDHPEPPLLMHGSVSLPAFFCKQLLAFPPNNIPS
jgi:hypothetical protein